MGFQEFGGQVGGYNVAFFDLGYSTEPFQPPLESPPSIQRTAHSMDNAASK